MAAHLWHVGVDNIFVDGSFAEEKDHPNDIDGYFECDLHFFASGDLARRLNVLDTYKSWTWDETSRRPYPGSAKKQLPMWHRHRVELYPHYNQLSGIKNKFGKDLIFPAAFRQCRSSGTPKGIIHLMKPRRKK